MNNTKTIKISSSETITDIDKFIESHTDIVQGGDEPWREVYKERLEKVLKIIENTEK